jgi:hypothetical protein
MQSGFFRQMAQQCRDMMRRAEAEDARQQLQLWAEEFDARAEAAETEENSQNPHGGANC